MIELPKSQRKWITPMHYSLMYNVDLKYLNCIFGKVRLKVKRCIKSEILFLDTVILGENETDVVKKMGEPFFIRRGYLAKRSHAVYTYGLKSGNNKLKVEMHFIENVFLFGIISYKNNFINYVELNTHLNEKYGFPDFNFLRDMVVDPWGNFLEFHVESNNLVVIISKKEQFNSTFTDF